MEQVAYLEEVQPILNNRCVACHSCYDAPAQLNLSCPGGLLRGATKQLVYKTRVKKAQPTRLHVDAETEDEWRGRGFFPVLGKREAESISERLKSSLIYQMISQTRMQTLPYDTSIAGLQRDPHDPAIAPTIEEFPAFAAKYPQSGMPFFCQRLSDKEFATISNWVAQGSPVEPLKADLSTLEQQSVNRWESYLNRDSLKSQLISRYIFEHLVISHLYFDDIPSSGYFKIVRSETPPGTKIKRVRTALCNDDPGVERVYYRLKKVHGIIKRKTHIVYPASAWKLTRYKVLFEAEDWDVEELPDYSNANKVNPFVTFADIPSKARYQFMLDDSFYFIQCYIRGPVCRGQSALNAIHDHFYIMFHSPESKLAMTDDAFWKQNMARMILPGNIGSQSARPVTYARVRTRRNRYLASRDKYLATAFTGDDKVGEIDIWAGDNRNSDPLLTVFRHFDTASVQPGFIGKTPATAWVIDFPVFERIYYALVVNFNVFGTAGHQLATRSYFDLLRHEAENSFLMFLPTGLRQKVQDEWYRGVKLHGVLDYQKPSKSIDTAIEFETDEPGLEFLRKVKRRSEALVKTPSELKWDDMVRSIPADVAPVVQFLPEMALIRVSDPATNGHDQVYTLIRNKAHENVAYIFGEESRREPERDTVMFIKGITGDYPNLMLVVSKDGRAQFSEQFHAADSEDKIVQLLKDYGVLRNSASFWQNLDWFQNYTPSTSPRDIGIFDLKHYILY